MTQANGRADTSGVEENKPQPPRFLLISRMLWIVAALVSALRTIWQLADREALIDVLHKAQPDLPQDQIDAAANSGILFALLLQALILLVVVRLTNRLLQGRNWVRVVLSIYGAGYVVLTLLSVLTLAALGSDAVEQLTAQPLTLSQVLFSVVIMLLEAAAVVLLFHPSVNRYFHATNRPRYQLGTPWQGY